MTATRQTSSSTRPTDGLTTLIFDVLGTVVDQSGSIREQASQILGDAGVEGGRIPSLLEHAEDRLDALMTEVIQGRRRWETHEQLRRSAWVDAIAEAGLERLSAPVLDELAAACHRLRPWPEAPGALRTLGRSFTVVALSNGDMAELVDLSAAGGLAWHGVLSGQFVRSFKPDPAVYRLALDLLAIAPGRAMLVAAHPFDLRAAAQQGLATAYIARPGAERPRPDDAFTLHAADLAELARQLGATP